MRLPNKPVIRCGAFIYILMLSAPSVAAIITFNDEPALQGAWAGVTVINLDAAPLNQHLSGYHVEEPSPAADFASLGLDFLFSNAAARANGQSVPAYDTQSH